MSKQPFVSVVIVNYNGRSFIGECVDSVLNSNYPNFEIVVVDNASTDGSYEYLKKKYHSKRKICLIRSNRQLYFTGGNNLGAQKAKGEKLIFLNSDTVVDKNWIKELVAFSKNEPKYLVQPKILFYHQKETIDNAGGKYVFPGFGFGIGRGNPDQGQFDKDYQVDFVNGTCFLIDKNFFWQLGGFDKTFRFFYEDIDLCLRARKMGGQCWYRGKSVIYHHGGKTFKENFNRQAIIPYIKRNRRRTIEKNFSGLDKLLRIITLSLIQHLPLRSSGAPFSP